MIIFNKIIQSTKEPSNKRDIWFDGKVFKIFNKGEWKNISLDINNLSSDTDEDVEEVWENIIKD